MFSDVIEGLDYAARYGVSGENFAHTLVIDQGLSDFFTTLYAERVRTSHHNEIIERARCRRRTVWHDAIFPVVPVYVTSMCQENCSYCNYRASNRSMEITRLRLTDAQLESEVAFLINEKGLRSIELVYATDPDFRVTEMCRHVELVRNAVDRVGGAVGLNAEPFDTEDYIRLQSAGLNFAVLWQETYDRETYARCHNMPTKKRDFAYRLNAPERMLEAGLRTIGLGVLTGLGPWKYDWSMLALHYTFLRSRVDNFTLILGTPRLKRVGGALTDPTSVAPTDTEFGAIVATFMAAYPACVPFLSTRECWEMCVELARGGGCLFTCDCKTIPGGYSLGVVGHQFPTNSFDTSRAVAELSRYGLRCLMSWTVDELARR